VELLNATKMQAAYTMGTEPSAREHIVVAVKGTFAFPERDGDMCELAAEQAPLIMADEFFGEPGFSAPRYEVDFALVKPKCDVLLNATAYAPRGDPQLGVKMCSGERSAGARDHAAARCDRRHAEDPARADEHCAEAPSERSHG
jgi:hypothetical protein